MKSLNQEQAKRITDRVLSLFLVDYLFSADPYEAELVVCGSCAQVGFGVAPCGSCAPPVQSYLRELGAIEDVG